MTSAPDNAVIFHRGRFWIVARRQTYGPFDYQWSGDLHGIEFTYQGHKFGEYCNDEEFFADLKPFALPLTVCRVAAITAGTLADGIRRGSSQAARLSRLAALLDRFGFSRFVLQDTEFP